MTSADLEIDRRLAGELGRTWNAFFARFGRLTAAQRVAIPPVLDGRDVLVCAPTASGKTEAVCAPLLERNLGLPRWTLLYISPTRALVNDLFERLQAPCGVLGATVLRKTGDHPSRPDVPPEVLITTPESFDSLLCRGAGGMAGHFLAWVRAVVLDEVHLLHGGPRGEQVRWLLSRLRRLRRYAVEQQWTKESSLQVCGLSATVDDPRDVANSYLRDGALVTIAGARQIEQVSVECEFPDVEHALTKLVHSGFAPDKILVFSNTRKRVDLLSHRFQPTLASFGYKVRAHHGSLDRAIREDAESVAKAASKVVLFATSTLEIGIDIGDIDLVVLDGPAPDVGSLLQRIGRGNRRTGLTRVMTCAGSLAEVMIQAAMMDDARKGHLPTKERGPNLAVSRQQLSSYIFQSPTNRRTEVALDSLLVENLPGNRSSELVSHLVSEREWMRGPDGVRLAQEWVDAAAYGEIHSNIESAAGQSVVDDESGAGIATGVRFRSGAGMLIGGQLLKVQSQSAFMVSVKATSDRGVAEGKWSYVSGAWFQGAGQPDSVRRFLGIEFGTWPVVSYLGTVLVFHFGGARRQAVLDLCRHAASVPGVLGIDPWVIYLAPEFAMKPSAFERIVPASIDYLIPERIASLEKMLVRPRANEHLPAAWRAREVSDWLLLDAECEAIRTANWVECQSPELLGQLGIIASGLRRFAKSV